MAAAENKIKGRVMEEGDGVEGSRRENEKISLRGKKRTYSWVI